MPVPPAAADVHFLMTLLAHRFALTKVTLLPFSALHNQTSDDSSEESSDVASEKGKSQLKSKLKKATKNVTWDKNND